MKQYDVIKRIVELAETGLEALQHIDLKLKSGELKQTITLMNDLVNAFYTIEKAVRPMLPDLLENKLEVLAEELKNAFDDMVSAYESGEINRANEVMQFKLMPGYKKWQAEIDRVFMPYLLS